VKQFEISSCWKICASQVEALKCREFLRIFPQKLGPVCVEKGYQRPELMRIHCTVLVIEFVVDGVAVGWELL